MPSIRKILRRAKSRTAFTASKWAALEADRTATVRRLEVLIEDLDSVARELKEAHRPSRGASQ
jgi:hypothetical protein